MCSSSGSAMSSETEEPGEQSNELKQMNPAKLKRYILFMCIFIFQQPFSRWTWVSRYQNVSILDFVGAKDDGRRGDSWGYKTCKVPLKSSPPTNQHTQHSAFYRQDALPVAQPAVSKH